MNIGPQTSEKFKNTVAFFIFSFVAYGYGNINFAAAEDILAMTTVSTSVVYICYVGPYSLGCLILPMFLHKLSPPLSVVMSFLLHTVGIVLMAFTEIIEAKLIGISSIALGISFTDVGLLPITTFYEEITTRAYTAGSGFGAVFAILYYTGMTTWLCVSMKTTLLLIAWLPLLIPLFYWLMDRKHSQVSKTTIHQDISYSPLNSASREERVNFTYKEKFKLIWYNMPLALSFYAGSFARYILQQAVLTTMVFLSAPFKPRDHYQYYLLAVVVGNVIGRSYGLVVLSLKCNLPQYTRHTWILSSLNVIFTVFLVVDAWFRYLHNVMTVIVTSFSVGLFSGIIYDFTFAAAYGEPSSPSREFSRAILAFPFSAAALFASLLGMYIEPLLEERCMYVARNVTQCLTRILHGGNSHVLAA